MSLHGKLLGCKLISPKNAQRKVKELCIPVNELSPTRCNRGDNKASSVGDVEAQFNKIVSHLRNLIF